MRAMSVITLLYVGAIIGCYISDKDRSKGKTKRERFNEFRESELAKDKS